METKRRKRESFSRKSRAHALAAMENLSIRRVLLLFTLPILTTSVPPHPNNKCRDSPFFCPSPYAKRGDGDVYQCSYNSNVSLGDNVCTQQECCETSCHALLLHGLLPGCDPGYTVRDDVHGGAFLNSEPHTLRSFCCVKRCFDNFRGTCPEGQSVRGEHDWHNCHPFHNAVDTCQNAEECCVSDGCEGEDRPPWCDDQCIGVDDFNCFLFHVVHRGMWQPLLVLLILCCCCCCCCRCCIRRYSRRKKDKGKKSLEDVMDEAAKVTATKIVEIPTITLESLPDLDEEKYLITPIDATDADADWDAETKFFYRGKSGCIYGPYKVTELIQFHEMNNIEDETCINGDTLLCHEYMMPGSWFKVSSMQCLHESIARVIPDGAHVDAGTQQVRIIL